MEFTIINSIIKKINNIKYFLWIKLLIFIRSLKRNNEKMVVIVADYAKPRVIKIAYALGKKGYEVELFLNSANKESLTKDNRKHFNKVFIFTNENELFKECLRVKPLVYHIFSEAWVENWAENMVKNKKNIGKIVYDQYDVFRDFARFRNRAIEKREKYCFENADGICCRSFETQHLKHKYGYSLAKRILFLDYCWDNFREGKTDVREGEGLKIIYGGRLLPSKTNDVLEKIEWEGFSYIASVLQKNKGYFVIVPLKKCDEAYCKFLDLKGRNRYVKIKNPMSFQKLIRYENRMDYGIDCVEFQSKTEDYGKLFGKVFDYKSKVKYYATNKYFDYIDAGIPALYGRENEMFGRYLSKYGGAIPCSLEELPEKMEWLKENRRINKEKVKRARKELAVEKQIDRLIKFYHQI